MPCCRFANNVTHRERDDDKCAVKWVKQTNNKDTVTPMQMTKKQKAKLNITFAFSAGFYMSCRFLFLFFGNNNFVTLFAVSLTWLYSRNSSWQYETKTMASPYDDNMKLKPLEQIINKPWGEIILQTVVHTKMCSIKLHQTLLANSLGINACSTHPLLFKWSLCKSSIRKTCNHSSCCFPGCSAAFLFF